MADQERERSLFVLLPRREGESQGRQPCPLREGLRGRGGDLGNTEASARVWGIHSQGKYPGLIWIFLGCSTAWRNPPWTTQI